MPDFNSWVALVGGVGAIGAFIWSLIKIINKISLLVHEIDQIKNQQCPCYDVKRLQETVKEHSKLFDNNADSISKLKESTLKLETNVESINKKLDKIGDDLQTILKQGVYK